MRRLILQPPRTCNCFHLVLAKFCIFDTCNFLRFLPAVGKGKSDALKQRSGHAIFNARTTIGQMPKKQYLCTRNQMRHESSEMASLKDFDKSKCSAPSFLLSPFERSSLGTPERKPLSTGDNISCQRTIQNSPAGRSNCAKARSRSLAGVPEARRAFQ